MGKVVGRDCHGVIVNGELLYTFGTRIDKAKTMGLSTLNFEFR
jgi:hypothetical protein